MSGGLPVTVGLVDDDPMVCQSLKLILSEYSNSQIQVLFTVTSGSEAVQNVKEMQPDVLLMDIAMPGMSGIEATALVRKLPSPPQVLMLTSLHPKETVNAAVEAGACGFISKTEEPKRIIERVIEAAQGKPQFDASGQRQLMNYLVSEQPYSRRDRARAQLNALPERERQAVVLAAQGLTNAEVADAMYISERTAKAHLSSASSTLGMNRIQMARLVERANL
ncbi:response regulator transcription factor [Gleimia hominis]|uniref:Response regulator transcription factor n=1 Tax=Gleimia hominis TaxID=595468 RepID=A0ABU3IA86_9ACTO|nr:response regulator transcription factor [Gleimia hominis]MDT3767277.1 response regulator transcription factor [Gleimia hominis]